jgi:regulator of RNase E activity RraA
MSAAARAPAIPPLPAKTVARLREVSTATLTTELFKLGFRNTYLPGVRALCPSLRMVGVAVTVRFVPAREDLSVLSRLSDPAYPQRHAIEHIEPGEVLVMDCRGVASAAAAGDILVARLQARGAAGLVVDGGIRDFEAVRALGFPVYALGPAAPAHVIRHLAVDEHVPIACAGVLVVPGDVMAGDGEGVVCVPRHVVDTVAADGVEQERLEAFLLEKIKCGAPLFGTYPPSAETLAEYEAHCRAPGELPSAGEGALPAQAGSAPVCQAARRAVPRALSQE